MCLVFYATCSLIFLIPIFNKKYTNKINTDNYSINTKTSFKNAWFNCYMNEEFKITSKDKAVSAYLEKELESNGFKKNKDKLIRRKKESGFCGNRKKEYEKVHSKTYATYKLNGSNDIKLNYNDEYKEDYVTFKINNKISNDVTINSNLNIKKIGEYIISYRLKLDNNYNVYSLDLIVHGQDNTSFENFNLSNCIQYVKETIEYIKTVHENCNIYLLGCSYGGFVLLNAYNDIINNINKIYLMK